MAQTFHLLRQITSTTNMQQFKHVQGKQTRPWFWMGSVIVCTSFPRRSIWKLENLCEETTSPPFALLAKVLHAFGFLVKGSRQETYHLGHDLQHWCARCVSALRQLFPRIKQIWMRPWNETNEQKLSNLETSVMPYQDIVERILKLIDVKRYLCAKDVPGDILHIAGWSSRQARMRLGGPKLWQYVLSFKYSLCGSFSSSSICTRSIAPCREGPHIYIPYNLCCPFQ